LKGFIRSGLPQRVHINISASVMLVPSSTCGVPISVDNGLTPFFAFKPFEICISRYKTQIENFFESFGRLCGKKQFFERKSLTSSFDVSQAAS
jgi:hypothetical protein